jgi:hypothetical protein
MEKRDFSPIPINVHSDTHPPKESAMKVFQSTTCLAIAASLALTACASTGLVQMEVKQSAVSGGKPLEMEFREVERETNASIVEVKYVSGASVPSSMFVMRGVCKVVRARGAKYFSSQKVFGAFEGKTRYRVSFHERADEMVEVDDDPYGLTKRKARVESASMCVLASIL